MCDQSAVYTVALCYRDDVEDNWFVCWNARRVERFDMTAERARGLAAFLNYALQRNQPEEQYKVVMQPEQAAA